MDKASSSVKAATVKHHKSPSSLQKRTPCKAGDEELLTQFSNSLDAAKLRKSGPHEKLHTYHTPVEFSWKQFFVTLFYENLPPGIIAPLAVLLVERSTSKAWHAINHRGLFVCSLKHNSRAKHIFYWVMFYPICWLITSALLLRLFSTTSLVENVDLFQIVLAYLFFSLRAVIVSVKYGFYRPEDYEQLNRPAPKWSEDRTDRRLVGVGWTEPRKFPGLIEDELTCAMDENDMTLQGIPFTLDTHTSEHLRQHVTDELFTAKTSCNNQNEVSAGFVLHQILSTVYNQKFPVRYTWVFMLSALAILLSTFLLRLTYGLDAFGATKLETFIFIGCGFGLFMSAATLNFGLICAHDFQRRTESLKKLGALIQYPGLRISEFLHHKPKSETDANAMDDGNLDDAHIFIDLKQPSNVFAWMMCRKTLRSFGEGFYLRIQAYTSILLFYAICCVVFLNMIAWTQPRHHIATIYLIILIVAVISSICIFAIVKAIKLQTLSSEQRDQLQNQLFLLEKELIDAENSGDAQLCKQINQAKVLLQQVDGSISFHELSHKPVRVLGYPTTQNVVSSALGIILTGFVLAGKGFSGSGIVYDLSGWFNY